MQTTAIGTVAKSLPENKAILLTLLISNRYIPYTDLLKIKRTLFPAYTLCATYSGVSQHIAFV